MITSPYAAAKTDKLDEIIRLAESRLAAQLTLGVAADQRAMTLASFLVAVDAALITAWAALPAGAGALWPIITLVCGFAVAAGFAVWSALPVAWEAPGSEPEASTTRCSPGTTSGSHPMRITSV